MDLNIETAQVERNENRASLESYDLTCQKCTGSTNPSIDPWDSFSTNGVKIPVDIGHCGFESVSKAGFDGLHCGVFYLTGPESSEPLKGSNLADLFFNVLGCYWS